MKSKIQNINYIACGNSELNSGRVSTQLGWYKLAAKICANKTVLDVGAGLGEGLAILQSKAKLAHGIEIDTRLKSDTIFNKDVSEITSKSYDCVTAIDVIEHVEEDLQFAGELIRIAKNYVMVSTPNWTASQCKWPYHVREYKPNELIDIFKPFGKVTLYKGTPTGEIFYVVTHLKLYLLLNYFRNFWATGFIARIFNFILMPNQKIHSHLFILVELSNSESATNN